MAQVVPQSHGIWRGAQAQRGGSTRHSISRSRLVDSVLVLTEDVNTPSTFVEDVIHDVKTSLYLIPGNILLNIFIVLTFVLRYFLNGMETAHSLYVLAVLNSLVASASCMIWLKPLVTVFYAVGMVVLGLVGAAIVNLPLLWIKAGRENVFQLWAMFVGGVWLGYFMGFSMLHTVRKTSLKTFFLISFFIGMSASVSTMGFTSYYCITLFLRDGNVFVEFLVTGVLYPMFISLYGKVILVEFVSYCMFSILKGASKRNLLRFLCRLVKYAFYIGGQIVVFNLRNRKSFLLALLMGIITEVLSIWLNLKIAERLAGKMDSRNLNKNQEQMSNFKNFIKSWWEDTKAHRKDYFGFHYFNEEISEKIIVNSVITIAGGFTFATNRGLLSAEEYFLRSGIILAAEFVEDLVKKRILSVVGNIHISRLHANVPSLMETLEGSFWVVGIITALLTAEYYAILLGYDGN